MQQGWEGKAQGEEEEEGDCETWRETHHVKVMMMVVSVDFNNRLLTPLLTSVFFVLSLSELNFFTYILKLSSLPS